MVSARNHLYAKLTMSVAKLNSRKLYCKDHLYKLLF